MLLARATCTPHRPSERRRRPAPLCPARQDYLHRCLDLLGYFLLVLAASEIRPLREYEGAISPPGGGGGGGDGSDGGGDGSGGGLGVGVGEGVPGFGRGFLVPILLGLGLWWLRLLEVCPLARSRPISPDLVPTSSRSHLAASLLSISP